MPRVEPSPDEAAKYRAAAEYSEARGGVALLVVHDGAVVFSRGSRAARPIYSGVKGLLCPLAVAAKVELEDVRDLLSMTSGLDEARWWAEVEDAKRPPDDRYTFALELPVLHTPGSTFQYSGVHAAAFGGHLVGRGVDPRKVALDLLRGIGVKPAKWSLDGAGHAVLSHGMSLTPEQWARVGMLMRDGASTKFAPCLRGSAVMPAYGLGWWLNAPLTETQAKRIPGILRERLSFPTPFAPAPPDLFAAIGNHDQRLYVVPSRGLVIVRMARTNRGAPFFDADLLRFF